MSVQLLDKTRKINKLLHNNSSSKVVFTDICRVLTGIMDSNVYVLSKKGKILGLWNSQSAKLDSALLMDSVGEYIDAHLNERFLEVLSTNENVILQMLGFENMEQHWFGIICPIDIAGERLGTVFMYRQNQPYNIDDIIVSEYGTTVVGLEMMRAVHDENAEEVRKKQIVKSAIKTLSASELEAILHIFEELGDGEGVLVASKIADRAGITRSVIVNAIRKFESAGVIESRSSGMKGTYIKVVNEYIMDEISELYESKKI
ncbi:MAG: GTP-sensing pleiotropic transcriptional regulator CodY [Blautia sp.]|nr:GTP-sensing pleiotropic transcriptional regulator CodY [Blautia sp.]